MNWKTITCIIVMTPLFLLKASYADDPGFKIEDVKSATITWSKCLPSGQYVTGPDGKHVLLKKSLNEAEFKRLVEILKGGEFRKLNGYPLNKTDNAKIGLNLDDGRSITGTVCDRCSTMLIPGGMWLLKNDPYKSYGKACSFFIELTQSSEN